MSKQSGFVGIITLIVVIIAVIVGGYFIYNNLSENSRTQKEINASLKEEQTSLKNAPAPTLNTDNGIKWKTAKFGGLFSFEYPSGWHVAYLWPQDHSDPLTIAINPEPIDNAPRDGPLATFTIQVINGKPNPDEILGQKKAEFSKGVNNIVTETLDSNIGKIYYYKGILGEGIGEGDTVEDYYFTVKPYENDPINQQVLIAFLYKGDAKSSEMLRHTVLSFKKQQIK